MKKDDYPILSLSKRSNQYLLVGGGGVSSLSSIFIKCTSNN